MKPAICVLFLVIWMTHEQFGWCKSQKFFPNGRYGRSDPSVSPLADYENNMENLIDDAAEPNSEITSNDSSKQDKPYKINNKLIKSLYGNRELKQDKFRSVLRASSDNYLFCIITNRSQLGNPIKLICNKAH